MIRTNSSILDLLTPFPTLKQVELFLLETKQHVFGIEYYATRLNIGVNDKQRPHDLVGLGNKLDPRVLYPFSSYHGRKNDGRPLFAEAIAFHRLQHHHVRFNEPHPDDINKPLDGLSDNLLLFYALDVAQSLLERRSFNCDVEASSGVDDLSVDTSSIPQHKLPYVIRVLDMLKEHTPLQTFQDITLQPTTADYLPQSLTVQIDSLIIGEYYQAIIDLRN